MKGKKFIAKIVATVAVAAILLASSALLFACNKDKGYTLGDIFKAENSDAEFTSSKLEFTLPTGWEIYLDSRKSTTSEKNKPTSLYSDVGYVKSADAFIVKHTSSGTLSVVKCGDDKEYYTGLMNGMLFPVSLGISALRVKDGLIVCRFNDNTLGAFDFNGKTVLSRTHFKDATDSVNIDSMIKILDSGLIAVHYAYDRSGAPEFTSVYRPTQNGGELVCRVANNSNALDKVSGFDGKYVTVVGNSVGDCIYLIPATANGNPQSMSGTANGKFVDMGQDDYECEITYIGNGKFFIHEEWTVDKNSDYMYYDEAEKDYFKMSRYIYTPDNDAIADYTANADKVFYNMSNSYYDSSRNGIDTKSYLNKGFTYVAYGLSIEEDKKAYYDQFILDSDMNIVMSLTGNYGISIKDQKKDKVGYYDLIMSNVDGYYYIPFSPSQVNIYDGSGKQVGFNERSTVLRQELSNNMIVAAITDPNDKNDTLFGAFNVYGKEVIEFKYTSLSAFRGAYTVGSRYNGDNVEELFMIGVDGKEIERLSDGSKPLADIASTSKDQAATNPVNTLIYKIGCYMYWEKIEGTYYYGVKNFNPNVDKNVIIEAKMAGGSLLYAPGNSPSDVFVFEKIGDRNNTVYSVYRLV